MEEVGNVKKIFFIVCLFILLTPLVAHAYVHTMPSEKFELERLAFLINSETGNSNDTSLYSYDKSIVTVCMRSFLSIQNQANLFTQNLFHTFLLFGNDKPDQVELNFHASSPGLVLIY